MRVECSTTIDVKHNTNVGELNRVLRGVPENAKISVDHYRGDQRDPGYTHLKFRWTEER